MLSASRVAVLSSGLGPELVTNGSFSVDANWTKAADWSISGGLASVNGAVTNMDIFQAIPVIDGLYYRIAFDIVSISANGRIFLLDPNFQTTPLITTGYKVFIVDSTAARAANITIRAVSGNGSSMTASIDNVSVRQFPGNTVVVPT